MRGKRGWRKRLEEKERQEALKRGEVPASSEWLPDRESEHAAGTQIDEKEYLDTGRTVVMTDADAAVHTLISGAGVVDEAEWEKVYLGIKQRGNYFDLVRNMYPFSLPKWCEQEQERKGRKYGWIARENMEVKCDPSKLIYWTPVNRNNHPRLPRPSFNKQGGVCREGHYLCYMPWRMYEARCDIQTELAKRPTLDQQEKANVDGEIGGHFDPTQGGRVSASKPGDSMIREATDTHPSEIYDEAGEAV
jgi:hypothetical protein